MGTEPHDAEYYRKKVAALETFLCWVQTGQRKFDGYDLFVDNTLNIMRQIRPVAQVDYQGRAVPIGLLPDSEGTKHQQVGTHGRAFVSDDWGPVLTLAVRTTHSAGTTIQYNFTTPAGFETKILETFTLASRAPDTLHHHYITRPSAAPAATITGVLFQGTTSTVGYWPNSDEVATVDAKNTVTDVYLATGDIVVFLITNNAQAGDTMDTIIRYQRRAIE